MSLSLLLIISCLIQSPFVTSSSRYQRDNLDNNYQITDNRQNGNRLIDQFMNNFNNEKRHKVTNNNNKMFGAKQLQFDDIYDDGDYDEYEYDAYDSESDSAEDDDDDFDLDSDYEYNDIYNDANDYEYQLDQQIDALYDELYDNNDYTNNNYYDNELLYTINALQSFYDENEMKKLNQKYAASQANYMKNYQYLQHELMQYYSNMNNPNMMQQQQEQSKIKQKKKISKAQEAYYDNLYSWYNGYNEWSPQMSADSGDHNEGAAPSGGHNSEIEEKEREIEKDEEKKQLKKEEGEIRAGVQKRFADQKKAKQDQEKKDKDAQADGTDPSGERSESSSNEDGNGGNDTQPPP